MADNDDKKDTENTAQPGFDPKPVQVGGDSIVDRLMPYRKKILIAVLLGFAVWAAIAVVFYVRNTKREKNTAKLAKVLEISQQQVRSPGVEPEPTAPEPTFATNKERADAVLDAIAKSGADVAPLYRASFLVQAGKLDEAIAEYRKQQAGAKIENVLAREGLGIAIEMKAQQGQDAAARQKGLEEALAIFQSMQPDPAGPRADYAHYHQGRILLLLGKTAEARASFEKAKEGGDAQLTELVDERLASLGAS